MPTPKCVARVVSDIWLDIYRQLVYLKVHIKQKELRMQTAKIFITGRSQAVRLPLEYRFDAKEVYIRRDPATGDVILSRRPESWDSFFALDETAAVPADFMTEADRNQGEHASRDPLGDTASQ